MDDNVEVEGDFSHNDRKRMLSSGRLAECSVVLITPTRARLYGASSMEPPVKSEQSDGHARENTARALLEMLNAES